MAGRKPDSAKRAQILRAATDVFSARDFHTVTVDDVAAAARVGKGTLYLYFPTKEQLFYATILEALDVLLSELAAATRSRDGEDGLRTFVGCLLDFFWRRRHLVVLMHRYEHKLRDPQSVEWYTRRNRIVMLARALIQREARAGGLGAQDVTLAAEMLLALVRAAVLSHQERDRPQHVARLVVNLFLRGLTGTRRLTASRGAKPVRAAGGRA